MPPISDQDMNSVLAEHSNTHQYDFHTMSAINELYHTYAKKYSEQVSNDNDNNNNNNNNSKNNNNNSKNKNNNNNNNNNNISRCYVKANSFVQFLCPNFALTYVEFALTSSRYSYGINPIVGIRLNVECL